MKYLFVLTFFCAVAFAQSFTITGKVVDGSDNAPLVKASITCSPNSEGCLSDNEGNFKLTLKSSVNNTIRISFVGFETFTSKVTEKLPQHFTVKLNRSVVPAQSIIISGSAIASDGRKASSETISKEELMRTGISKDVPELLSSSPSVNWFSESGSGNGYNYLSIRGFDQRRIAVLVNGIPQNDPEDHNVYWIDFNDILGSSDFIQVQRGTGAGMFGFPAIGGAINIMTNSVSKNPAFELAMQSGSYNTKKYSASYTSGVLNDRYSFSTRLSQTLSDGYRELSKTKLSSYYFSLVRFDDNIISQLNFYGGPFQDQLVYTGLPKFAIASKTERRKNYSWWSLDSVYQTAPRRSDEGEQFFQPHFELLNEVKLSDNIKINSALFLISSSGYFDYDGSWANYSYYRLTPANGFSVSGDPDALYIPNAIIRANVENKQWGWIPRMNVKFGDHELNFGLEMRFHQSLHWGALQYGTSIPAETSPSYHYYSYNVKKTILNGFINDIYSLNNEIKLLGELQFNYSKYRLFNEKYLGNDISVPNTFINPKVGLSYIFSENSKLFFNISSVAREPRLTNYYNAAEASDGSTVPQFAKHSDGTYDYSNPYVKPERLSDIEVGYDFSTKDLNVFANIYLMQFKNEIVQIGQVDRFGQPLTGNMPKTRHSGVELSIAYKIVNDLELRLNATFSKNSIIEGSYTIYDYTSPFETTPRNVVLDLKENAISNSPAILSGLILTYSPDKFKFVLSGNYVGEFYSDNFGNRFSDLSSEFFNYLPYTDNLNEAYFTAKFYASYSFSAEPFMNNSNIYFQVNNIFNKLYSSYAIGKEFFPAAERNILFGINVGL